MLIYICSREKDILLQLEFAIVMFYKRYVALKKTVDQIRIHNTLFVV